MLKKCYFNFPEPSKILVVGGYSNDSIPSGNFVEIIDLKNPKFKCKFFHEKANLLGHVGGIILDQPVICGGFNATTYEPETKKCIVIGSPDKNLEMLQLRQHPPSGVVIDSSKIWIVGKIYFNVWLKIFFRNNNKVAICAYYMLIWLLVLSA